MRAILLICIGLVSSMLLPACSGCRNQPPPASIDEPAIEGGPASEAGVDDGDAGITDANEDETDAQLVPATEPDINE